MHKQEDLALSICIVPVEEGMMDWASSHSEPDPPEDNTIALFFDINKLQLATGVLAAGVSQRTATGREP